MRRRWGAKRFIDRCRLVSDSLDTPALTTDVIVGFPGETEEDFEETCRVCEVVGFSKIHIFPFSPRRTTPAAEMNEQVPANVKMERVRRLEALEAELRETYYRRLVGRRLGILIESPGMLEGYVMGTSCRYAPVQVPVASGAAIGKFVEAIPTRLDANNILTV
jgi:threonylcarbamoyladenosine tRNA methylthiotransferase MtaB